MSTLHERVIAHLAADQREALAAASLEDVIAALLDRLEGAHGTVRREPASSETIATIRRGPHKEIRIAICSFPASRPYADLRLWRRLPGYGWRPTRGVSLQAHELDQAILALDQVAELLDAPPIETTEPGSCPETHNGETQP